MFKLHSKYSPAGDQPKAIEGLVKGVNKNLRDQVLLGVTGSGKTFTMANVIAETNKPTLVISHNKTLAAQLYQEFKEFFPENAVHYFVSYYDYYQPEAYIPHTDTYIEKEATINDEIDRLRHAATQALINRRDVIVVASVSCIYGIGEREDYEGMGKKFFRGQKIARNEILRQLVGIQYDRNDVDPRHGAFKVRGEEIDIVLATGESIVKLILSSDEIENIFIFPSGEKFSRKISEKLDSIFILPAKHFVAPESKMKESMVTIRAELNARLEELRKNNKLLEAQRLEQRTNYDLEMIAEVGYCNGIENYSRHFSGKSAGEPPTTLVDFFPKDSLMIIDESHVTLPQIRGMYAGDRARKETLVDFGFRLPSAKDNRPLNFQEFDQRITQAVYVSATPAEYELVKSQNTVEQIVRPTGLMDPEISIRPLDNQVEDLIAEIKKQVAAGQRTLVTVLTKRLAEELSEYLLDQGIKTAYLHSEVETFDRVDILRDLRSGRFDVLVGINLLREGLDLPEVSLVAILDADTGGFLRHETALMQTIGRAARHQDGRVIMYADVLTPAIKAAIKETKRRRKIQEEYNKLNKITPRTIVKEIRSSDFNS